MLQLMENKKNAVNNFTELFQPFETISLEKTNELAQMLSRVDNKYVVDYGQFKKLLTLLNHKYAIMEIKDKIQFSYQSCYYDDANYATYFAHHQGRRNRFKIRTREYVDSNLIFFESKFKGARGVCNKHRMLCDTLIMPKITGDHFQLINGKHNSYYYTDIKIDLKPSLMVKYKRCTLVAVQGGERVTIDFNLEFSNPNNTKDSVKIGNDFIIIETKSADGKGFADRAFSQLKIRQAERCSKYCLGLNLTRSVTKNNRFLTSIRHISKNIVESFNQKKPNNPGFSLTKNSPIGAIK